MLSKSKTCSLLYTLQALRPLRLGGFIIQGTFFVMVGIQLFINMNNPFPTSAQKAQARPRSYNIDPPSQLSFCCLNRRPKIAVVSSVPFNSIPPLAMAWKSPQVQSLVRTSKACCRSCPSSPCAFASVGFAGASSSRRSGLFVMMETRAWLRAASTA